jgi:hypothetical protein
VAARDTLEHSIGELRRLGRDLNTDLWQQRSLVDAISAEADRIERVARVRVHVEVQGTPPALPPDHTTILFRVLQEVVNNALKHSRADTLTITLAAGPPWSLTLSDNGRGFDATTTAGHPPPLRPHRPGGHLHHRARPGLHLDHHPHTCPWNITWPWWTTTTWCAAGSPPPWTTSAATA